MIKRKLHMRLLAAALVICLCTAGCAAGDSQKQETGKRSIIIAGSTSVQPLSEMLAEAYMEQNREVEIEVQGGGSGQGIKAIETKIAHIGSLSRDIKEEEEAAISREYTIAREGIAVVVNPEVKVDELSLEQIRDILISHRGETPVLIYMGTTGKSMKTKPDLWVNPDEAFQEQVIRLIGRDNLKL